MGCIRVYKGTTAQDTLLAIFSASFFAIVFGHFLIDNMVVQGWVCVGILSVLMKTIYCTLTMYPGNMTNAMIFLHDILREISCKKHAWVTIINVWGWEERRD